MSSISAKTSGEGDVVNIGGLPVSILLDIFKYLPMRSLLSVAQTCRLFYDITRSRVIRQKFQLVIKDGSKLTDYHCGSDGIVYPNVLLHTSTIDNRIELFFEKKGQFICNLIVNSNSNNFSWLAHTTNVQYLKLIGCDFSDYGPECKNIEMRSLKSLQLIDCRNVSKALEFFQMQTFKLQEFILEDHQNFNVNQTRIIHNFLKQNCSHLKHVALRLRNDNLLNNITFLNLHLERLEVNVYDKNSDAALMQILQQQRDGLKYLKISYFSKDDISCSCIPAIYRNQRNLRELSIVRMGSFGNESTSEIMTNALDHLPLLNILEIKYLHQHLIFGIECKSVHRNMRHLSLKYANEITLQDNLIQNLSVCCPQLTSLEIHNLNDEIASDVFKYLLTLRQLKILSNSEQNLNCFKSIANLQSLESLTIFRPSHLFTQSEFISNHFVLPKLRYLHIESEISEESFRNISKNCPRLEHLRLNCNLFDLNKELIHFIAIHLHELKTFQIRQNTPQPSDNDGLEEFMRNICKNLEYVALKYC